jgi:hypothetical protein
MLDDAPVSEFVCPEFSLDDAEAAAGKFEARPHAAVIGLELEEAPRPSPDPDKEVATIRLLR